MESKKKKKGCDEPRGRTGIKMRHLCDHLEGWDKEGGRETQERGDKVIYMYS